MGTQRSIGRDALGLGLRAPHHRYVLQHWPTLDYFELISENFMGDVGPARHVLDQLRQRYPLVLHGVGLNLLGASELDERYVERLCALAEYVDAPFVSDHLCWTGAHGINHHDLLPTPYTEDLAELAAQRASWVQRQLGRPFGLENLSSYVEFSASTLTEWEFYRAVVDAAGCSFMLDVNNIYVSSVNHGFDADAYLGSIDFERVLQVHIAGHSVVDHPRLPRSSLIDTHDQPVTAAVWELYARAWQRGGPFPTLLEWDARLPPFDALLLELDKARTVRA
jgi:uncharacterized protein